MHGSGAPGSRRYLLTAAAAVTVILAAGCGAVPAPDAPGHTQSAGPDHSPRRPATAGAPADSHAAAIGYGRALLASLPLPPGAHMISQPVISMPVYSQPAKRIDGLTPFTIPAILTDMIDIAVVYQASLSMAGDYSYVLTHKPSGTTLNANGYSMLSSSVTTEFVCYVPATLPAGIFSADLETSFKAVHGGSLVRADAVIAWYPPRSPADYIDPKRYASVTISHRTSKFDKTSVLTSPAAVATWAALVNGLRGAPEAMSSGGANVSVINTYEIVFTSASGAPTVAVLPVDPLYVSVIVGGRSEPSLSPGDVLLSRIQQELRS